MDKNKIIEALKGYPQEDVEKYASYCVRLSTERDKKTRQLKNPWILKIPDTQLAQYFKRVAKEKLAFDGVHITLQSTGISYDYIAYKNKMFIAYPESEVDVSLVYHGDEFSFSKESGKVTYTHKIANPFEQKDVIGGYCIIKNKRGEFITILSREDIDKHRKVAKTDYIWQQWFAEMALKTVIKKACKQHFADVYSSIEEADNENYNIENPLDIDLKLKQEIDAIDNLEDLKNFYHANKGKGKEFDKYISIRKQQLNENPQS